MEKDPNMQGRRAASRATKLRRRKARMNFVLLAGFAVLIALLVLVTPKDPIRRAQFSLTAVPQMGQKLYSPLSDRSKPHAGQLAG